MVMHGMNGMHGSFYTVRKMDRNSSWKAIIDKLPQPPAQFWIDFSKFITATHEGDDTDERWEKLVRWADILANRYNNELANTIILKYLDCLGNTDT